MEAATPGPSLPAGESRYRLLVDSITDYAVYMLDADGRVASWNPGAQRFKGYLAEEILGESFTRFYTPEDQATGLPAFALRQAAEQGRFEQEGWRVRKDGSHFWAHVVIDPIPSPSGGVLGYAKITRDLTERRGAEEALRRSEEQFKLLVQAVTDYAIYMLDLSGRVVSWNAGAERIKGYRPDEILGQSFTRFYTEEDRAAGLPETALRTAASEGRFEKEGWRIRKDGTRFLAHVVIDAIHNDRGEVIGFAKVTRDITERMQAQRALDEAREALLQSQKMEAIGRLTGGIAHDFNNLLMAVMGSLELIGKRLPYDPRVTPLLDNAMQGAQRGAALTQRMLAFARKQDLQLEAVDTPSLVRGMIAFLQQTIGPTIEVNMRFDSDLPRAHSDPSQLEAALINLVVNARDAMPGGGVIRIGARREHLDTPQDLLSPGDYVCLSVEDEGEGMDAETLARATEPFFTTKGVGKGTGLGLSMVHGFAAQTGGRICITSARGKGAKVELWVPAAIEDEASTDSLDDPSHPAGDGRRRRILVVDDDPLVLTNTVAMLEDLGHEVVFASSGQEGLQALEHNPAVELVITDEVMPRMSGSQLAQAVRALRPDIALILATGYADQADSPVFSAPRLSKPFTQQELKSRIAAVLDGGGAA